MFLGYFDQYRSPEESMIDSVYESIKENPIVKYPKFQLFECKTSLLEFLKLQFSDCNYFGILKVFPENKIHVDPGRVNAFNYIIETGGSNVETVFWNNIQGEQELQRVKIEPFRWCSLDVSIPHSIENILYDRVLITVWKNMPKNIIASKLE